MAHGAVTELDLGLTCRELEKLLSKPQYKAVKRVDYKKLSPALMIGVKKVESIVSFGQEAIYLFDNLASELNRLPTMTEYIEAGMPIYQQYWNDNKETHPKINGFPFEKGVRIGVQDRLARTYTSKVVELHLELLLKELGYKVYSHPLIDNIMGVDLIVEDNKKRYYIHVTTSKRGQNGAEKSVRQKEKRGKFLIGETWVQYGRDFSGDCVLCYESLIPLRDNSTKWINNNPVFKKSYIFDYIEYRRIGNKGELLTSEQSKLQDFKDWAKTILKVDIEVD